MLCPRCGRETPDGSQRCEACGAALAGIAPGPAESPTYAAAPSPASTPSSSLVETRLSSAGPASWSPGEIIAARYRLDRKLGAGGMGAVYLAQDLELDIPVALKIVRPEMLADAAGSGFLSRFKQELLTARRVTHRNVLRIHDLGEANGHKFITMPYVRGCDLHQLMGKRRLTADEIVDIGGQIAAGLSAAHEAGVVHRDLKPQNVLIAEDGVAFISDFGLAKSLDSNLMMTRSGEFVGTPQYISPEQVEGRPADHRSDLYAFGLMLYEMACGQVPFTAPSALETMLRRVREAPPPPKSLATDVPDFLDGIVLRCLERDPDRRYQRAAHILADLQARRSPDPLDPVAEASVPEAPVPRARRGAKATLAWSALAVLMVLIVALAVPVLRRSSPAADAVTSAAAAPAASRRDRVAVMPFAVAGDQESLAFVATGFRESLGTKLFELDGLIVSAPAAVDRAASLGAPAETARALGVTRLVGGTVQGAGDRLRVAVWVDDATGGRPWAREYEGRTGDLLSLQDRAFADVVSALGIVPAESELAQTLAHPTENIDAYELYLRGRTAMRDEQNIARVREALDYFERARERDPRFALAYAGIADATLRLYRDSKDETWSAKALAAVEQARTLDDSRAEVHSAAGSVYQAIGRTHEAIAELRRAAELAPTSDAAHRRLARAYLDSGRADDARAAYQRAIEINPYHWVNYGTYGGALVSLGDMGGAADAFRKVAELDPGNANAHGDLGGVLLQLGEYDQAIEALRKAIAIDATHQQAHTNLGIAFAYAGRFEEAVPHFEKGAELSPKSELETGNLADGYRWAGDTARAEQTYRRALALALAELRVNSRSAEKRGAVALYYAKLGNDRLAQRWIRDARDINPSDVTLQYGEALVHLFGGRKEQAVEALRRAVAAGYPTSAAAKDPDMRPLRDDPVWKTLN